MDKQESNRLKTAYKQEVRCYQEQRRKIFEESKTDNFGNILVHPFCIQSLLNQRARVSRAFRRWKRKGKK